MAIRYLKKLIAFGEGLIRYHALHVDMAPLDPSAPISSALQRKINESEGKFLQTFFQDQALLRDDNQSSHHLMWQPHNVVDTLLEDRSEYVSSYRERLTSPLGVSA